ncbi:hypothetical protein ON010_g7196 [Phytophthora cinnamomi]|nr:hypothetical protein ON010_g7196 [Phytophthora cinnamomi]
MLRTITRRIDYKSQSTGNQSHAGRNSSSVDKIPRPAELMSPKTVLITGSTRGIGLEFAKHFTTAGWNVIGVARSAGTADELKALSPFKVVSFDCTDEASIAQAAQDLKGVPIDLLINNAGIYMSGELHTTTKDMLMRQFEVNTVGPFLVTRALLPNLKLGAEMNGKDGALVVTVSSQMGSIAGNMYGGNYSYGASKAAVNMVNSSLAIDLKKDNIAAIVVHPGYVVTDLTGGMGDVHTDESVRGMTSVIETVTMKDTGQLGALEVEELGRVVQRQARDHLGHAGNGVFRKHDAVVVGQVRLDVARLQHHGHDLVLLQVHGQVGVDHVERGLGRAVAVHLAVRHLVVVVVDLVQRPAERAVQVGMDAAQQARDGRDDGLAAGVGGQLEVREQRERGEEGPYRVDLEVAHERVLGHARVRARLQDAGVVDEQVDGDAGQLLGQAEDRGFREHNGVGLKVGRTHVGGLVDVARRADDLPPSLGVVPGEGSIVDGVNTVGPATAATSTCADQSETADGHFCAECQRIVPEPRAEHADFHFALKLSQAQRGEAMAIAGAARPKKKKGPLDAFLAR